MNVTNPRGSGRSHGSYIIGNVKTSAFVALAALLALTIGCGRERQPNVRPGDDRVFKRIMVADAGAGVTTRGREDETVSEEEFGRRNLVRQIADQFRNAKSGDDRLEALDSLDKVLGVLKGRAPELVPHVARSLTDPDSDQRIYGIRARAAISPKDALPDIKLVLRDSEPKVRQAAVEAFQMLPDPLPCDVLFAHLANEREPFVQQAVMLVISSRGKESEVPRVLDLVPTLDLKAVGPVIDLARKYPAAARPRADALAYFLDRNDADLRMQVAKILGEWGTRTPAVTSGLVRALNDPELSVRKAAFMALKSFSNQDFGYLPEADAKARQEALSRWRAWARQGAEGGKPPADQPETSPASR